MSVLQSTIEILEKLVSFDTTSRNSNLALIEWIEEYLRDYPVECERMPNADSTKAALFVTIGKTGKPGIIFSGHTDVVPVDNQIWASDPFQLTAKESRIYGRGTSDMKGFIACCLAMVPAWSRMDLDRPVHFAFSFDEEIGCRAAASIGQYIAQKDWKPLLVLVGEPTLMQPVAAHKGIYSYLTRVTGKEAHSSQTQIGANAIQYAAKLINKINNLAEESKTKLDARFTPAYTTLQVGIIRGGTARNIIPRNCEFEWEIRPLPSDDPPQIWQEFLSYQQELNAEMKAISSACGIVTEPVTRVLSLRPETEESLIHLMLRLAESNELQAVSYGTEGGIIQSCGFPCFICGPGSIEQAHIPNEYIEIGQLEKCLGFLQRLENQLLIKQ